MRHIHRAVLRAIETGGVNTVSVKTDPGGILQTPINAMKGERGRTRSPIRPILLLRGTDRGRNDE